MSDEPRGSAFVWLNLVCLDAPLVAISWQWLFARDFGIPIVRGGSAALFLTAWLIYLADRFGDSLSVDARGPVSLRQRFCARHRAAWIVAMVLIGSADVLVVATQLEPRAFSIGLGIGACAVAYLAVNRTWSFLWRFLPLKEVSVGFLFAAGTVVALRAGLTKGFLLAWLVFGFLCSLNCVCIAVWERGVDEAQGRVSIATEFPQLGRVVPLLLALLTLASFAIACFEADSRSIYVGIVVSGLLLGVVHLFGRGISPDTRTALADLVLLTPAALLVLRFGARLAGA